MTMLKALLLSACFHVIVSSASAAYADTSTAAPAAEDSPQSLTSGTNLTLPKAWSRRPVVGGMIATAPEGDLDVALIEVPDAASADEAASKAWSDYKPGVHRAIKLKTPSPGRDGWDDAVDIQYETSPAEKQFVFASVHRKGTLWLVEILNGAQATADKRSAAVDLLFSSPRPAGYVKETFAGRSPHALDARRVERMKTFVTSSMKALDIPGASMALIDHDRIVFEGGFGVREVGKPMPVDAHTAFMIASNTKSMSTLLLARQIDAGKAQWDEKVVNVYPPFRLGSDATTAKVEIRHLVCACTGLPQKDMEWFFNTTPTLPASDTFVQLAKTEPTSGFGELYQYNNNMAAAAGYIAGHLVYPQLELGAAYDKAMQTQIFDPLGMHDTTFSFDRAMRGNYALPYAYDVDGKVAPVMMEQNYTAIPYRPAAGAWSSAHDMILYVRNELNQGMLPNGHRLIGAGNLLERRRPNVPSGEHSKYGMGLEVDDQWGVQVVHHGGSMAGYKSDFVFVPDADIGAVILTNSENGGAMLRPFMRRLLELIYDGKAEAAENVASSAAETKAWYAKTREKIQVPATGLHLAADYSNHDLGYLKVTVRDGHTWIKVPAFSSEVGTRSNEDGTTSLTLLTPTLVGMSLLVGEKDGKSTLTLRDSQHQYVYLPI